MSSTRPGPPGWVNSSWPRWVSFWWPLTWLQVEPDRTATELLLRLQEEHPGEYPDKNLRTLQRRVKLWRRAAARKLVFTKDVVDAAACSVTEIAS